MNHKLHLFVISINPTFKTLGYNRSIGCMLLGQRKHALLQAWFITAIFFPKTFHLRKTAKTERLCVPAVSLKALLWSLQSESTSRNFTLCESMKQVRSSTCGLLHRGHVQPPRDNPYTLPETMSELSRLQASKLIWLYVALLKCNKIIFGFVYRETLHGWECLFCMDINDFM